MSGYRNGRLPAAILHTFPAVYSTTGKTERLERGAAAALVRASLRVVAQTGAAFTLNDAYRPLDEQIAMFAARYRPRAVPVRLAKTDRAYQGRIWRLVSGAPVAAPGLSNHGGVDKGGNLTAAIDVAAGPARAWFQTKGRAYGWSWDEGRRIGEGWHFTYDAALDQHRGEGMPDVEAIQRALGVTVDGKVGPETVAAVKSWQAGHGLTVDGIAGPATVAALTGAAAAAAPVEPPPVAAPSALTIDTSRHALRFNDTRPAGVTPEHITIHWWGTPVGQTHDGIVRWFCDDPKVDTSAHYIVSPGRVSRIVDEDEVAWANGNRVANQAGLSIECDPNDVDGTLPTVAALVADIRSRWGDLPLVPHKHWKATTCPGAYTDRLDELDRLARGTTTTIPTAAPETVPAAAAALPEGAALMAALVNAPDFPLLRTPAHRCYYGPASGPRESVSGKNDNALAPGEVTGGGAQGLRQWQARMKARGYAIAVDGRYGDESAGAARNLQRLAGLEQDGLIGPDTWYAAWVLPVQ